MHDIQRTNLARWAAAVATLLAFCLGSVGMQRGVWPLWRPTRSILFVHARPRAAAYLILQAYIVHRAAGCWCQERYRHSRRGSGGERDTRPQ
jgi:hypothetical protein